MKYILEYSIKAQKQLEDLPDQEASRIVKKLDYFCKLTNPLVESKPMAGEFNGCYRFRIGKFRVIFSIDDKGEFQILLVLKVGKRSEIYR